MAVNSNFQTVATRRKAILPVFERLRAAAIDGRTENVRYRQNELQRLHKALRECRSLIVEGIMAAGQVTTSEAELEYYLAMQSLRDEFDSLNFEQAMEEEYAITRRRNCTTRRVGVGIVLIHPTTYTRFYSIISPMAAAVSAGNCLLLELESRASPVDAVLEDILPRVLDKDAFAMTGEKVEDERLLALCLAVEQTGTRQIAARTALYSNTDARVVAIVDRTADLTQAAQSIVTARYSFQGRSPYAPDLVLVNEYVKGEFFAECTRAMSQLFASQSQKKGLDKSSISMAHEETLEALKTALDDGSVSAFGSADFQLVDILNRDANVAKIKIRSRILLVLSVTGLVDAVTIEKESHLLAAYLFANPTSAKFLGQHLDAHITWVNQIPPQLLVGPASAMSEPASFPSRYNADMFSVARPQFISPLSAEHVLIRDVLQKPNSTTLNEIRALALKPLPPTGQKAGHAIGFFEQGIITGGLTIVLPAVVALSAGVIFALKMLYTRFI